jgi:hypothetical protein
MRKATGHSRVIEFIGDHRNHDIVIGNYGDVKIIAKGTFDLGGLIYCTKNTVELTVNGIGNLSFSGVCNRLVIRGILGNCRLDLTHLTSKVVWCESVKDNATILLGPTKLIELISLDNEAVVKYDGNPALLNYSLRGNSKIENTKTAVEAIS